jgi:hypothetical protein
MVVECILKSVGAAVANLQLPMQSVPITTKVVSLNLKYTIKYWLTFSDTCTCLSQTSLRPPFVFGIDMCSVYPG